MKTLEILKKDKDIFLTKSLAEAMKTRDIIVTKIKWEEEILEDGTKISRPIKEKTNITKKINEQKKLIKKNIAEQVQKEYDEIFREIEK